MVLGEGEGASRRRPLGRGFMKCLPQREERVSAIRDGNVEARVDVTKLSKGHGLKGVPRHGTIVVCPCSKFVLPGSRVAGDTGEVSLHLRV